MNQRSKLPTPEHRDIPLSPQLYKLVLLEGKDAPTDKALAAISSIKITTDGYGGVRFHLVVEDDECEICFEPNGEVVMHTYPLD
jgi:hypothetical protein